jgi:hypothetical protein
MKKILLAIVFILMAGVMFAQCTPDPACTSNICPDTVTNLPHVNGPLYSTQLTLVVPSNFMGYTVNYIRLDSISGLPLNFTYTPNSPSWPGGSSGCAAINGAANSSQIGTYPIIIYGTANIAGIGDYPNPIPGYRLIIDPLAGADKTINCGSSVQLNAISYLSGSITFSWNPVTNLSNPGISNPVASPSTTTTYTVTASNGTQTETDNVTVFVTPLAGFSPEICMVTVDANIMKNKIIWEKPASQFIDGINIYKEVSTNVYSFLAIVDYDSLSYFIDQTSLPLAHADRYKISIVDKCTFETIKSPYHNTINLGVSQGVPSSTMVLNWNAYQVESGSFVPNKYYIYRGLQADSLFIHDSISASFTSYNDLNVMNPYYYAIVVKKPGGCTASKEKQAFTEIYSNLKDISAFFNVQEIGNEQKLILYPNPGNDYLIFETFFQINDATLTIFDLQGQLLLRQPIQQAKTEIKIANLAKGLYFLRVDCEEGAFVRKFVKE